MDPAKSETWKFLLSGLSSSPGVLAGDCELSEESSELFWRLLKEPEVELLGVFDF